MKRNESKWKILKKENRQRIQGCEKRVKNRLKEKFEDYIKKKRNKGEANKKVQVVDIQKRAEQNYD